MRELPATDILTPSTRDDLVAALSRATSRTRLLAGGTDVVVSATTSVQGVMFVPPVPYPPVVVGLALPPRLMPTPPAPVSVPRPPPPIPHSVGAI